MAMNCSVPVKEMTLEAVVIRADGTRENLGVIAHSHANPIIHSYRTLKYAVERKLRWLLALLQS